MKINHTKYLLLLLMVFTANITVAQENNTPANDSSIQFKVYGACEQCKDRIEAAVNLTGVRSAVWDVETKMLRITYNPATISLDLIENRIVAAGHDLNNKKASNKVYRKLPECCRYRDLKQTVHEKPVHPMMNAVTDSLTANGITPAVADKNVVRGVVMESNQQGAFKPLEGASVTWLGTAKGVSTNSDGVFSIQQEGAFNSLLISFTGFQPDTITVTDIRTLRIILAASNQLKEVTVRSKQLSTYLLALNPIRTQVMTEKELFKAACCNLSESFETNPSVDVSYNDAVTGSKQIQLLGLSGNYTQLTVENLPGPRGLATALGLNAIAGPWVESIQLTKGIGSVANGFESIAGQINVELKKPENSEKLFANVYINDQGKTDLNLNLSKQIGNNWSTALLLHDDFLANRNIDFNKDGFRDLPTGNQFSFINRWKYEDQQGFMTQFGIKLLNDDRTGGELRFDPSRDKYSTRSYGLGIQTERYEAFVKTGYVFPEKKYKSIGIQLSAIDHQQNSYFGLTTYNARQRNFYANLIYQSIISTTTHKFRTGISYVADRYREVLNGMRYNRTELVPGAFFEYTFTPSEKLSMIAGLRGDHNNLYGFFATPRLHIKYEPVKGTTLRLSAGRGQRTANIFAENTGILVSARQLQIISSTTGKAYGLDAEVAWNKGFSADQKFRLFQRNAMLSIDYFRNDFTQQVVVDLEDPRQIRFYNLEGRSWSNSVQAEINAEPLKDLSVRLAYRFFDVKTTYSGKELQRPLIATNRAFANLAYAISNWKFDYTINYNGRKRIPGTQTNPVADQRASYSPGFIGMNAQISKTIGKKHPMDFYLGGENLTGFIQEEVIIAPDRPFGATFDSSLVWGPVTGRMIYAGWRYKIR